MAEVDAVIGNEEKLETPAAMPISAAPRLEKVRVNDIMKRARDRRPDD